MRPEKFPHPIPQEPQNYMPPFKINDTFRTVWVKFRGEIVEARWKVIALDPVTSEPTHVELETIENVPHPIGAVRYVNSPEGVRLQSACYTKERSVIYQYPISSPHISILDACEMVERDRNYA